MGTEISYVSGVGGGKGLANRGRGMRKRPGAHHYKPGMLRLPHAHKLHEMSDLEFDLRLAKQNAEIKRDNYRKVAGIGTLQEYDYTAKIAGINDLIQAVSNGDPEMISLIADDIDNGTYNVRDKVAGIGTMHGRNAAMRAHFLAMRQKRYARHSAGLRAMAGKVYQAMHRERNPHKRALLARRYHDLIAAAGRAQTANMHGIGKLRLGKFFKKVAKGLGKGLKAAGKFAGKVGKGLLKVVTFPMRLAAKGILEVSLPKAAPWFLYLFITNPAIIKTLPAKIQKKRRHQERIANFIINGIGMKRKHFMGIVRNGIEKRYHMTPEKFLSKMFKRQISGVGFIVIDVILAILDKIGAIFGKKPTAEDKESAKEGTPDFQGDSDGMTDEQRDSASTAVANQPVQTFTAASYDSNGNASGSGTYSFGAKSSGGGGGSDDGGSSGGSDAGNSSSDSAASAAQPTTAETPTAEDLTGGDAAQASEGWC